MEIFKRVLKEIGISCILILVIGAVIVVAFYNKIPFSKQIPESIHYSKINRNEYSVRGDVENTTSETETFMSSAQELRYYELIKLVLPGKINPFSSIGGETDIPTEKVSGTVSGYVPPVDEGNMQPSDYYNDPVQGIMDSVDDTVNAGSIDPSRLNTGGTEAEY